MHFITFFTEGGEFDRGTDLTDQKLSLLELINTDFATKTAYSPRRLINLDQKWKAIFEDKREYMHQQLPHFDKNMAWNINWAALNFLLWKPALIAHVLKHDERIAYGDIIFYHDVDLKKYPSYKYDIKSWGNFIKEKMGSRCVLLFNDNDLRLSNDVKSELLLKYFENAEKAKNLHHIWAGALAIKKSEYGLQFANRWLKLTNELENRSQLTIYSNEPGFHWHSQEQACLSVLYHKEKHLSQVNCEFLNGDRCIPPKKLSYLSWKYQKHTPIIVQKALKKFKSVIVLLKDRIL